MKDIDPHGVSGLQPWQNWTIQDRPGWEALSTADKEAYVSGEKPVPIQFFNFVNASRHHQGLPSFPRRWLKDWPNAWPMQLPARDDEAAWKYFGE